MKKVSYQSQVDVPHQKYKYQELTFGGYWMDAEDQSSSWKKKEILKKIVA